MKAPGGGSPAAGWAAIWLMPMTPPTMLAIDPGMFTRPSASRSVFPAEAYSPRLVPNTFSTWAAVPEAGTVIRSAGTVPTLKPSDFNHLTAWFTSETVGENCASHCLVVT